VTPVHGDEVPLVDLGPQHGEIAAEVTAGWERVVSARSFVLGDEVQAFETEFAAFCGIAHCVGVGNGTDALELALRALGIGPGDEVVVPANSFVASAMAVSRAGGRPVLVDVDPSTLLIDPAAVERALGPRTRAVMPVHLYGQMAPMAAVGKLAAGAGIAVVEDAAQSHGAHQGADAVSAGSLGAVAATSFYPGKNLGAYGDGGAVLTGSGEVAQRLRRLRNHGSERKYHHEEIGCNSRLDPLQAVVLRAKLRRLEAWNAERRRLAARYGALLADVPAVTRPVVGPGNVPVWHLYVVQVAERDRVLADLAAAGVGAGVHYPVPIHLQPAYAFLGHGEGDFPVAEAAARRVLSLPLYPGMEASQQDRVVEALGAAVR
jgi:dTDP-4-amino-4,6-dideoxygalactose transaminase